MTDPHPHSVVAPAPIPAAATNRLLVATPFGRAELSVTTMDVDIELAPLEIGRHAAIFGDRAVVRSRIAGRADVFQIFERSARLRLWRPVTPDLTASQVENWAAARVPATTSMTAQFDAWLDSISDQQRPAGGGNRGTRRS